MRIVRIDKASDARRIVAATAKAAPGRLERLNPHLDLKRLAPGAVLVLPDGDTPQLAALGAGASTVGADVMESFIGFAKEALVASSRRLKAAADRTVAEESALATAAKSKAVEAALEKDPELKKLLDVAIGQAKQDTQDASKNVESFSALSESALAELETLAKRLS